MEPLEASARENYRLWLRYDDGACGEVDLSHLVGQGVFAAWSDPAFYQTARLTPHGSVAWGEGDRIATLRGRALPATHGQIGQGCDARCASHRGRTRRPRGRGETQ